MWCRTLLLLSVPALAATAQQPDSIPAGPGTTVSGIVRDSIGRTPLAAALVQLVAAGDAAGFVRTEETDSLGRFRFTGVQDGRYMLGFFHPLLDSLGLEPPVRELVVTRRRAMHADLGTPSPARLNAAICGASDPPADRRRAGVRANASGAVLMGAVRNADDGAPVAGATVTGEWLEYQVTRAGIDRRVVRRVATTGAAGWFALCDVPRGGTVTLLAAQGTDSTDHIELQVPETEMMRRVLYLGRAQVADAAPRADSAAPPMRVRLGDGRLRGLVLAAATGLPIAGARVGISRGADTRTNERGEWTLSDVPRGTRLLEVRAVGFYPVDRPVDVTGETVPVRVAMSTFKAVMDTVRITARRVQDRHLSGFADRRRSGMGRYLTPEDIARRQPIATSDIFRSVAGLRVAGPRGALRTRISMGGAFGDCSPSLYINGHHIPAAERDEQSGASILTTDDIDSWVNPEDIAGIEVYTGAMVPAQFQVGLSGCGSIVIWTK